MQIIRSVLGLSPPCRRDALAGAREACRVADEAIDRHDRKTLDWGPSLAACARAEAETGYTQEAHLPIAAGDTLESQVPSPDTVHAEDRARVRRSVLGYHDDDCSPEAPQPRQKDLP